MHYLDKSNTRARFYEPVQKTDLYGNKMILMNRLYTKILLSLLYYLIAGNPRYYSYIQHGICSPMIHNTLIVRLPILKYLCFV